MQGERGKKEGVECRGRGSEGVCTMQGGGCKRERVECRGERGKKEGVECRGRGVRGR